MSFALTNRFEDFRMVLKLVAILLGKGCRNESSVALELPTVIDKMGKAESLGIRLTLAGNASSLPYLPNTDLFRRDLSHIWFRHSDILRPI